MKIIRDLDELEKGLDEYIVSPSEVYCSEEQEININLYKENKENVMKFSSSLLPGVRWAIDLLQKKLATLGSIYIVEDNIVSISITTRPSLMNLRDKITRSSESIGRIF